LFRHSGQAGAAADRSVFHMMAVWPAGRRSNAALAAEITPAGTTARAIENHDLPVSGRSSEEVDLTIPMPTGSHFW